MANVVRNVIATFLSSLQSLSHELNWEINLLSLNRVLPSLTIYLMLLPAATDLTIQGTPPTLNAAPL